MNEQLELINDEGNVETFYIVEETRLVGTPYILVAESDEEESDAYILKDVSGDTDAEAEYIFVYDEEELDAVASVFREMLEDIELK